MFSRNRLVAIIAVAILVGAVAGVIAAQAGTNGKPRADTAPPAEAASTSSQSADTTGWDSVAAVQATLSAAGDESNGQFDLTDAAIASTHVIYTFPPSTPAVGGASIFEVPRDGEGPCVFLVGTGDCWAQPPAVDATVALPVQVGMSDFDGPSGPLPVVLFGQVAPEVKAVTLICKDATYSATISDGLASWVAPSSDITPSDCELNAPLASGEVFSERM
jgi:hypothetical protein